MKIKHLIVLLIFILVNSALFADEIDETGGKEETAKTDGISTNDKSDKTKKTDNDTFPRHTITLDLGTALISLQVTNIMQDVGSSENFIFGSALQYEYQYTRKTSFAIRFDYRMLHTFDTELTTMTLGGHARVYPRGRVFFLDGMLGYANLMMTKENKDMPMSHYFKYGGKLGWRIDFGSPGGFVFEPSIGYYMIFGKTHIERQDIDDFDSDLFFLFYNFSNVVNEYMIRYNFVGGFTFNLAVGYRF